MLGITAAYAGLALAIDVGFSLAWAWLVMPSSRLELAVVGAVFPWLYSHHDDSEWIVIGDDYVRIVQRVGDRGWRHDFQRYWTRVIHERGRRALSLAIASRFTWSLCRYRQRHDRRGQTSAGKKN